MGNAGLNGDVDVIFMDLQRLKRTVSDDARLFRDAQRERTEEGKDTYCMIRELQDSIKQLQRMLVRGGLAQATDFEEVTA